MRGPSLQKTTIISFTLHLTACLIILLVVKQSNKIIIPSPYTVDLVSPDVVVSEDKGKNTIAVPQAPKASVPVKVVPKKKIARVAPREKDAHTGSESIEEKIAVLSAKKRLERTVKLRSVISIKASANKEKSHPQTTSAQTGKGGSDMGISYTDLVNSKISEKWERWLWADKGAKDLETIIAIKILKNGTTIIKRVEKSSGNPEFDKSALRALTKANPLPPPPYEMEIGVRFNP
jgi:colicin import membrane protein